MSRTQPGGVTTFFGVVIPVSAILVSAPAIAGITTKPDAVTTVRTNALNLINPPLPRTESPTKQHAKQLAHSIYDRPVTRNIGFN
ncbi:hypothetical protein [Amycolatopsis aidingensis]|uniref:hypothetical protein n=1 Tax=Amycolatopsis aidingensis TaxID=2842453 RepID=UPI001E5611A8|nr:hypothetical protein [Amycolatopsis aidingensis]